MTTDDALWDAARTGDRAAALALADAIEDEDLAYAVRWCGARGRWPLDRVAASGVVVVFRWCWMREGRGEMNAKTRRARKQYPAAALPGMVYDVRIARESRSVQVWQGWTSFRTELDALLWLARRLRAGRDVFEARW